MLQYTCSCWNCERAFTRISIASHRAMHRRKKQDCIISYTNGDTYFYEFSKEINEKKLHNCDCGHPVFDFKGVKLPQKYITLARRRT